MVVQIGLSIVTYAKIDYCNIFLFLFNFHYVVFHLKIMVTFKELWNKLYYTQHTLLNNVRQLFFFVFFFWETNTHTEERKRDFNIKTHHNSTQKISLMKMHILVLSSKYISFKPILYNILQFHNFWLAYINFNIELTFKDNKICNLNIHKRQ